MCVLFITEHQPPEPCGALLGTAIWGCCLLCTLQTSSCSPLTKTLWPGDYAPCFTDEETEAQPKVIQLANAEPGLHSANTSECLQTPGPAGHCDRKQSIQGPQSPVGSSLVDSWTLHNEQTRVGWLSGGLGCYSSSQQEPGIAVFFTTQCCRALQCTLKTLEKCVENDLFYHCQPGHV